MGFLLSYIVVNFATEIGQIASSLIPFGLLDPQDAALFFALILTAVSCIILGAGIPTTACYIILVAIAAPALGLLGVEPIVAHFFVFYFGVLADLTPPVALAAYAGAAIANADPFKTGNTAFRLALAKALVPFVFVYSPSILIMVENFSLLEFFFATISCAVGVGLLGVGFSGYVNRRLATWERLAVGFAAFFFIVPNYKATIVGTVLIVLVLLVPKVRSLYEKP